jgi:hypothetical protein
MRAGEFFEVVVPSGAWAPPVVLGRCGSVLTAPADAVAGVSPVWGEELAEEVLVGVGVVGRASDGGRPVPVRGRASWRPGDEVEDPSATAVDCSVLSCPPLEEWAPEVACWCCVSLWCGPALEREQRRAAESLARPLSEAAGVPWAGGCAFVGTRGCVARREEMVGAAARGANCANWARGPLLCPFPPLPIRAEGERNEGGRRRRRF